MEGSEVIFISGLIYMVGRVSQVNRVQAMKKRKVWRCNMSVVEMSAAVAVEGLMTMKKGESRTWIRGNREFVLCKGE